jgi:hypothetical protein
MSSSPLGSAQNSDAENDTRIPGKWSILFPIYSFFFDYSDAPIYNTPSSIIRMAHKIQHKFVFNRFVHVAYTTHAFASVLLILTCRVFLLMV